MSEETGTISIALDGQIERGLSPDDLRNRLRSLVTLRKAAGIRRESLRCVAPASGTAIDGQPGGSAIIRALSRHHLGLKLLAIALATLLWLTVAGEHVVERSLRVPLEFRNIPSDARDRRQSADHRRRAPARVVGAPEPPAAGRDRRGARSATSARPGRGCFTCAPTKCARRSASKSPRSCPATLALELETSAQAYGADRAGARRRAGAWLRQSAGHVGSADGGDRRAGEPREAAERRRRPSRLPSPAAASRVRDVVTVGIADSSVRLAQPQNATVTVEIVPAPVERELADVPVRWRNLGPGLRAAGVAVARRGSPYAATRSARRCSGPAASRRSSTLPGSDPAGTIFGFRSIRREASGSARSSPPCRRDDQVDRSAPFTNRPYVPSTVWHRRRPRARRATIRSTTRRSRAWARALVRAMGGDRQTRPARCGFSSAATRASRVSGSSASLPAACTPRARRSRPPA